MYLAWISYLDMSLGSQLSRKSINRIWSFYWIFLLLWNTRVFCFVYNVGNSYALLPCNVKCKACTLTYKAHTPCKCVKCSEPAFGVRKRYYVNEQHIFIFLMHIILYRTIELTYIHMHPHNTHSLFLSPLFFSL